MIEESKYCSGVVKKQINEELVMTKEDNEDFKNSTKCWICEYQYVLNVWKKLEMETMTDYQDLYLECDVFYIIFIFYIHLDASNLYGYAMPKILPARALKWMDPKEFDLNKYTSNSSKGCVLEINLEYPKELQELHSDYPSAPDKIEIKREMLREYQLKFSDLCNILIGNVKNLVPTFFW